MNIHPTFYPDDNLWVAEDGTAAESLAALQRAFPRATLVGYYPDGYRAGAAPALETSPQLRATLRSSHYNAGKSVHARLKKATVAAKAPAAPRVPKPARRAADWTEADAQELRRLADLGYSQVACAVELKRTVCAVAGKAHRLGVTFQGNFLGSKRKVLPEQYVTGNGKGLSAASAVPTAVPHPPTPQR